MFEELINRMDKILPVGGGVGTSVTYLFKHGLILNNINVLLSQCMVTFFLAIIGGIGGWLGGYAIKKFYSYISKKRWFKKAWKLNEKEK